MAVIIRWSSCTHLDIVSHRAWHFESILSAQDLAWLTSNGLWVFQPSWATIAGKPLKSITY